MRKLGSEFLIELFEIRAALGSLIGCLVSDRSTFDDVEALCVALAGMCGAETALARQVAYLAYFRSSSKAFATVCWGCCIVWVEHTFGGREYELTGSLCRPRLGGR
uniref:B2168_C2_205 n=1 Tax=Mycobacterium leprae TaxID=1769 RepID=Q49812_MYCLR|nr:B2168_C2_205 [Mycobacterium leprae]